MNTEFETFKAAVAAFELADQRTNMDKSEEAFTQWNKAYSVLEKAAVKVGKKPDLDDLINLITEYNQKRFNLILI